MHYGRESKGWADRILGLVHLISKHRHPSKFSVSFTSILIDHDIKDTNNLVIQEEGCLINEKYSNGIIYGEEKTTSILQI